MYYLWFYSFVYYLMIIIGALVSVAFLTLFERKVLSYIQDRKGPNKLGFIGLIQPFSDAIKLFTKENFKLMKGMHVMYYFGPLYLFFLSMVMMLSMSHSAELFVCVNSFYFLMSCLGVLVYSMLFSSWSSNSNYSILGGIRAVAQSLSYEVIFFFIFLNLMVYVESFSVMSIYYMFQNTSLFYVNFPLLIMFMIVVLVDLNRIPFDLVEGESELVSGYNTEYMSGSFALFFLGEYMALYVFSMLQSLIFFGFKMDSVWYIIGVLFFLFMFILIRGCLPRLRYDKLMYLCWFNLLPIIMALLYMLSIYKYYLYILL